MIPWSALSFLTLYFQYSGLSDTQAGVAAGCLYLGAMISGPLAGILGDSVSLYSPNHGRPTVGQLSMLLRIPLVLLSFLLLPPSATSFFTYTFCCLGLGLCSVGGVVVNRPLLADLVLPPHRATVFAIVRHFIMAHNNRWLQTYYLRRRQHLLLSVVFADYRAGRCLWCAAGRTARWNFVRNSVRIRTYRKPATYSYSRSCETSQRHSARSLACVFNLHTVVVLAYYLRIHTLDIRHGCWASSGQRMS